MTTDGILVVEDDPDMQVLLQEAMEANGYEGEIRFAEDGAEALEILFGVHEGDDGAPDAASLPSLVLLDLDMPHVDGFEVLDRLRSTDDTQTTPVVVLSRFRTPGARDRATGLGASQVLRKPTRFDELVDLVGETLDRWLDDGRPSASSTAAP